MDLITGIKRQIILKAFEIKKKKHPFNLEESELHQLEKYADYSINNSYYFGANNADNGDCLILRLGQRNTDKHEIFLFYRDKDIFLIFDGDRCDAVNCPLTITCIVPGERWKVAFRGELVEYESKTPHHCEFEYEFLSKHEIFDFFLHADTFSMATSIASAKWNKHFFAHSKNTGGQRHYEQIGRIKGKAFIDGIEKSFDMPAVRDHSFGTREWDYMDDHIWLSAVTAKGEAINFSLVNYPAMKHIYLGYSDIGLNKPTYLVDYKIKRYDHNDGLGTDLFEADLMFQNGQTLTIKSKRDANLFVPFDGGKYYFQEGIGEFDINGVKARGTIEYGFNENKKRWESYDKDL